MLGNFYFFFVSTSLAYNNNFLSQVIITWDKKLTTTHTVHLHFDSY